MNSSSFSCSADARGDVSSSWRDSAAQGSAGSVTAAEHAIVSIPHECLLGDDRDVDDIIAAATKVASRATELASANLEKSK